MNSKTLSSIVATLILLTACSGTPATPANSLVGTWTTTVTKDDILRVVPDFNTSFICDNAGTFVWQFNADGTFALDQTASIEGCPKPIVAHIESTWANEGNSVTFDVGTPEQETYEWAVDADSLTFKRTAGDCTPCLAINTANPWKRVVK